ncbi:hypothetical protein, partial [Delftia acidovorans]|uniref:hypothetical protein n=1 Tax=Delftia acidovorans TaxID=80866 RepID=UPI001D0CCAA0
MKFDLDERDSNPDRKDEVQRALLERFAATARSFEFSFVGMDRKHERIRVQFDARGCAEFCVNGQSTAGASWPVRKHYEHQETRR